MVKGYLIKRHSEKYEQQAAEVSALLNRTDGTDKSIFKVDLPPSQFYATQMLGLSHAS